jgi:diguanylate cyclase (GGDEF)-like protein
MTASMTTSRSKRKILSVAALTGIRPRLMLLAVLALVPLTIDRVHVLDASRMERVGQASVEAADLVRRGAEGQHEVMVTIRSVLQAIGHSFPAAIKNEPCTQFLGTFTSDIPWVSSLSVLDKSGRIVCSTNPRAVGLDASDRDYFKHVVEEKTFVVSDYLVSRTQRMPSIITAYPIENGGDDAVAVIAPVNLSWIGRFSNASANRDLASMVLVDSKGTVLARYPDPDQWVGKNISDHSLFREMSETPRGNFTTVGLEGTRRIFSFAPVPWTNAQLAVGLDEKKVLSKIDGQILSAYAQLALFAFLTLVGAWFLGEKLIVDPIRALTQKATRFGRGELESRFKKETWLAEFAPLATALDDMAHKLAARESELQTANRHLTTLATSDGLSGLTNRRGFDARLAAEWQLARELQRPIALLMIDVDHFKLFNDHYGHIEGDNALRCIADALSVLTDETDCAARYGGEEFVLLLPGRDMDAAIDLGERLRRSIESRGLLNAEAPAGQLTASVGVAAVTPGETDSPERLVEAADIALYAAKRRGRNCVVAHTPVVFAEAV